LVELFFGLLANKALPMGEREACAHLFAGAIGMFKNPASHRHVGRGRSKGVDLIGELPAALGRRIANASSRLSARNPRASMTAIVAEASSDR
jgi:hypothetical protein